VGKSKAPPPPDYGPVAAAQQASAEASLQLGREQLAWAKEQWAKDSAITNRVVDSFLADMDETSEAAVRDRARYEEKYQPLEDDLINDAKTYDTQERRDQQMGMAQAGVATQFNAQRENAQKDLEAYGIDPSSTRYSALDMGMRTAQAAAQASAGTVASNRVEDTARALRSEAINIGKGYPGQIAQSYGVSQGAGQGAAGATNAATQTGANTMGTGVQWNGQGNQALAGWGNTLNMGYQNQLDRVKANNTSSGWGSALGLVGGLAGKAFGLAEGGAVPDPQEGGAIPDEMSPSGGAIVDDVPARLNAGEFVIPDDAVSWFGEKHLYGLIDKAQRERDEAKQQTGAIPTEGPPLQEPPVYTSK